MDQQKNLTMAQFELGDRSFDWTIPKNDLSRFLAFMNQFDGLGEILKKHQVSDYPSVEGAKFITIWKSVSVYATTYDNFEGVLKDSNNKDIAHYRLDDSLGWVEIVRTFKDKSDQKS